MLRLAIGIAVVLAAVGVACFVMTTSRLPFFPRVFLGHGCPRCERRFSSLSASLIHEITEHEHP